MDKKLLPELSSLAKRIYSYSGVEGLAKFKYIPVACGCMGPDDGEYKCPCSQSKELEKNMDTVIRSFDCQIADQVKIMKMKDETKTY